MLTTKVSVIFFYVIIAIKHDPDRLVWTNKISVVVVLNCRILKSVYSFTENVIPCAIGENAVQKNYVT